MVQVSEALFAFHSRPDSQVSVVKGLGRRHPARCTDGRGPELTALAAGHAGGFRCWLRTTTRHRIMETLRKSQRFPMTVAQIQNLEAELSQWEDPAGLRKSGMKNTISFCLAEPCAEFDDGRSQDLGGL